MIKLILKIVFGLIGVILLILIITGTILYFTIGDSTDNPPIDLYETGITLESELQSVMDDAIDDLSPGDTEINITLTEDNINRIIYGMIVEIVNEDYLPTEEDMNYINEVSVPDSVPFIAGKTANIKHAYMEMNDDGQMQFFMTASAVGFKTNVNFLVSFTEPTVDDDKYYISIENFKLGKLNLLGNIGKWLFKSLIPSEEEMNENMENNGFPFEYDEETMAITFTSAVLKEFLLGKLDSDSTFSAYDINLNIIE